MADSSAPSPTYDSKQDGETSLSGFAQLWVDALNQATNEEKDWRDKAESTLEIYRGGGKTGRSFNILHSNIETICPALYNSTPAPDVRRRFSDPDPTAKVVADIVERALAFSIDDYDFDAVMKAVIKDGEICGRGVPRVRYIPQFGDPMTDPDGNPLMDADESPLQEVTYETVQCDYVPWRYFRRGPGRTWKDVSWIAFGDFLTKDDVIKLNPELADEIPYNYSSETGKDKKPGTEEQSIYRRALVWQIWDKDKRRVISIADGYNEAPLAVEDDPLELADFFPTPRPYVPVSSPDSLTPVVPYSIYEDLAQELNDVTKRISRLVGQLRPRGMYGGQDALDISAWANADDGELVPATNAQMFEGGIEKLIAWFPLDPVVKALQALLLQRDQIKQTIYEVMGLGDILRGASQASETATAQSIKAQWGSLRIQNRQAEVARVARDLFRLKTEIISSKFSWDTLSQMTGIVVPNTQEREMAKQQVAQFMQAQQQAQASGQPPPPVPQGGEKIKKAAEGPVREEVEKVMRSDILRLYRIDVESDSTIRGDMSRNQQTMSAFLQGTAQFAQSMGPIVQQSPNMLPVVMEIYSAFCRHFKLGKSAEDALDSMADLARQSGQGQQKPNPKVEAEKAKAEASMAQTKMDMQASQAEHQMNMQRLMAEGKMDQAKLGTEAQRLELEKQRVALKAQQANPFGQMAQMSLPPANIPTQQMSMPPNGYRP